jgi:AcrR family transcriptional regulator
VTAAPQPRTMNERVVAAAVALTTEVGWPGVTMAKLAERVGVSRQTVYNEIGSKPALAEAMVLRELTLFLAGVEAAFDAHPRDLVAAVRAAAFEVMTEARTNALLQAVVSASYGAQTELLPLLTTRSDALVDTAKAVMGHRVSSYPVGLEPHHLDAALDMIVRLVLSHVVHPSGTPEQTAADVAWIAERVLRSDPSSPDG